MNMTDTTLDNLAVVEEIYVDGELMVFSQGTVGDKDLPKLGRAIRQLESDIEQIEEYKKAELERIRDTCLRKQESKQASIKFLLLQAEGLLKARGERKYDMPGIGYFGFRKSPQSVLTGDYDAMSEAQQKEVQELYPNLFTTKVVIQPNKKVIKEAFDGDTVAEGIPFAISQQEEKLTFKGE